MIETHEDLSTIGDMTEVIFEDVTGAHWHGHLTEIDPGAKTAKLLRGAGATPVTYLIPKPKEADGA